MPGLSEMLSSLFMGADPRVPPAEPDAEAAAARDAFEAAAARNRAAYPNLPAPGTNPIGQAVQRFVAQPSWLERATEQSTKDRAAYETGGVPALMADTSVGQELAGGFGGTTIGKASPGSLGAKLAGAAETKAAPRGVDFWDYSPDPATVSRNLILPGDTRVSTRFPTAVGSQENPLTHHLSAGLEDMVQKSTPEMLAHNLALVAEYPGLKHLQGLPPAEQARGYVDFAKGNLQHIWENAPKVMQERSPIWYEGANRFTEALANRYGVPRPAASGATAVLSPQKDWLQNASLGERVGDIVTGASKPWSSDMLAYARGSDTLNKGLNAEIVQRIAGKRLDQLDDPIERAMWVRLYDEAHNPRAYRSITPEGGLGDYVLNADGTPAKVAWGSGGEVAKAIQMYESGGNMDTISRLLGNKHKVRSFYNNIENPNDPRFGDVTADTHQVAAGLLRPLSGNTPEVSHNFGNSLDVKFQPPGYQGTKSSSISGLQGTYPLNVEATRGLAQELGMMPRAVQSGVWEPVRELFTDTFKSNSKNVGAIDDIWRAYDRKELSLEQARRAIFERAGGVGQPSWARPGSPAHDPARASTYR
jgi:hypothetical protein